MVQVVSWCAVRTTWYIRTSETSLTSVAPYHAGRYVGRGGVWGGGEEGEKGNCYCLFLSPQHDLDDADRSMLFVCSATHKTKVGGRQLPVADSQGYKLSHVMSSPNTHPHTPTHTHTRTLIVQHMFFFLVQTEQSDIFKVTLEADDDVVSEPSSRSHDHCSRSHDHLCYR